jgi:hypothetical protein
MFTLRGFVLSVYGPNRAANFTMTAPFFKSQDKYRHLCTVRCAHTLSTCSALGVMLEGEIKVLIKSPHFSFC